MDRGTKGGIKLTDFNFNLPEEGARALSEWISKQEAEGFHQADLIYLENPKVILASDDCTDCGVIGFGEHATEMKETWNTPGKGIINLLSALNQDIPENIDSGEYDYDKGFVRRIQSELRHHDVPILEKGYFECYGTLRGRSEDRIKALLIEVHDDYLDILIAVYSMFYDEKNKLVGELIVNNIGYSGPYTVWWHFDFDQHTIWKPTSKEE
jgi:hypothetical protein